ncbi:unnamed protein product [Kuraishia capsulata CBS 1993]|uniref:EH domain-containing protein n=1 Tax=Kuraishia capsulata CBS 1993 TaxID=1382522 RepID=W6MNE4_9ASCO|nr:uncharacterized protein KUCA_T00002519001 [Kuraishia capsulata CBS 1993]CDK26547.1 unnamed protein product [Kuraishia capsulata CBS 1993]
MSGLGFDWLNIPGIESETTGTATPPPPVSFGVSPTSSSSSLNLASVAKSSHHPESHLKFDSLFEKLSTSVHHDMNRRVQSADNIDRLRTPEAQSTPELQHSESMNGTNDEIEFKDDPSIPLSLTADQLTSQEAKTYLRWYSDMLTRRESKTVSLEDVFQFMNNFGIIPSLKKLLQRIFSKSARSLNIGQFFALLRLVAHCLQGQPPSRSLIKVQAPVPKPISILSRKRIKESEESGSNDEVDDEMGVDSKEDSKEKLDIDSFTAFMLTGRRPEDESGPKKKKRSGGKQVKFSDQIVTQVETVDDPPTAGSLDWSLPMEQLLGKVSSSQRDENEEEELRDMQDSINHFQNVNIDSVSIHGTPSNIPSAFFDQNGNLSPALDQGNLSPEKTPANSYFDYTQPLATQSTGSLVNPQPTPAVVTQLTGGPISATPPISIQVTGSANGLMPPPPPPRHRATSSPVQFSISSSPVVSSPLAQNGRMMSQTPPPPPPPPPRSRAATVGSRLNPPPPPPRSRKNSSPPVMIPGGADSAYGSGNGENILGDLKALKAEVERIKAMGIQN